VRFAWLGLFVLLACSKGSADPKGTAPKPRDAMTAPADADTAKLDGAGLYKALCSQCHGPDAKGYKADFAPSLVNKTFLESATDEYIRKSIEVGRPGTSMAPYGKEFGGPLDKAAVDKVVAWLRAQGPQAQVLGTAAAAGDPKRGVPLYAHWCTKCHGDATTRVNAVHLANPNFLGVASDAFIRYAVVNGRPGTPMESFTGKLTTQEIDDVVAFVRTLGSPLPMPQLPPPTGKEPLVINPNGKDPVWKKLRSDPGSKDPRYVPADEVKQALDQKRRIVIIDARPPSDWMRVHITGAVSIPYHDMKRLAEIPKDVWVIAYCACPHHLSGVVVDELWKQGHKRALILDEGILEWHRRGYTVVAAEGVQPPPKEAVPPGPPLQ